MNCKFNGEIKHALFKDLKCGDCFCIYSKVYGDYHYSGEYHVYIKINDDEANNALSLPCYLANIEPDQEVVIPAKAEIVIEGLGKGFK